MIIYVIIDFKYSDIFGAKYSYYYDFEPKGNIIEDKKEITKNNTIYSLKIDLENASTEEIMKIFDGMPLAKLKILLNKDEMLKEMYFSYIGQKKTKDEIKKMKEQMNDTENMAFMSLVSNFMK